MHRFSNKPFKNAAKIRTLILLFLGFCAAMVLLFFTVFTIQESPSSQGSAKWEQELSATENRKENSVDNVIAKIDGFSPEEEEVAIVDSTFRNVVLEGQVIYEKETPVSEATIRAVRITTLEAPLKASAYQVFETESGQDGWFGFNKLPLGTYALCAIWKELAGHGHVRIDRPAGKDDSSTKSVTLYLKDAEEIAGHVKSQKGTFIKNALVMPLNMKSALTRTDERGRFTLHGLSKGSYTVAVQADGFGPQSRTAVKTGNKNLIFTLTPHSTLSETIAASRQRSSASGTIGNQRSTLERSAPQNVEPGQQVVPPPDRFLEKYDPMRQGRFPPGRNPRREGSRSFDRPPPPPVKDSTEKK